MGKKTKSYKILKEFPAKSKCCFCLKSTADPGLFGEIYQISSFTLHYLCLLSASDIIQRGKDYEGLLGFLTRDIKAEISRGEKRVCCYCKKRGATVRCHDSKCRLEFHLPCGLNNGSLHEYFQDFRSFCKKHAPKQKVPVELASLEEVNCPICWVEVNLEIDRYLWLTCCKKSLLHKKCCQEMALNAGYALKCPLCNDVEVFGKNVRKYGIFVPDQEASWELEVRRNRLNDANTITCMASFGEKKCLCPRGPKYSLRASKRWYIEVCRYCGGGMHLGCMTYELGRNEEFICEGCAIVNRAPNADPPVEVNNEEIDKGIEEIDKGIEEIDKDIEKSDKNVEEIDKGIEEVDTESEEEIEEVTRFRAAVGLSNREGRPLLNRNVEREGSRRSRLSRLSAPGGSIANSQSANDDFEIIEVSSDDESTTPGPPPAKRPALTSPKRPVPLPICPEFILPRRPALTCPHFKESKHDHGVRTLYFLLTEYKPPKITDPEGVTDKETQSGDQRSPPVYMVLTDNGFVDSPLPPPQPSTEIGLRVTSVCSIHPSQFDLLGSEASFEPILSTTSSSVRSVDVNSTTIVISDSEDEAGEPSSMGESSNAQSLAKDHFRKIKKKGTHSKAIKKHRHRKSLNDKFENDKTSFSLRDLCKSVLTNSMNHKIKRPSKTTVGEGRCVRDSRAGRPQTDHSGQSTCQPVIEVNKLT